MHRNSPSISSSPSPTTTAARLPLRNSSSSSRLGKIIGGSVGGLSLLALLFLAVWVVIVHTRHKKRREGIHTTSTKDLSEEATFKGDMVHIEPFLDMKTGTYT